MDKIIVVLLMLYWLLAGCSTLSPDSQPTASMISVAGATISVTSSPAPSYTPVPAMYTPTPTSTALPTQTPPPTPDILTQICLEIPEEETSLDVASDLGRVLLVNRQDDRHFYVLDLASGEQYDLPLQYPEDPFLVGSDVSPDGSMLAYLEGRQHEILWVVANSGEVLGKFTPFGLGLESNGWIDNEQLVFWYGEKVGEVMVFNPFSGEKRYLVPTFPDNSTELPLPVFYWTVQYSPNLEWVAYAKGWPTGIPGVGVWDVTAQKMIWEKNADAGDYYLNPPEWDSSGEWVAIVVDGVLYRVNRAGEVKLLSGPNNSGLGYIGTSSVSPNGRYLAIWVNAKGYNNVRLLVLDTETDQIIDYCIDSANHFNRIEWSFDAQQFVVWVAEQNAKDQLFDQVIFIDQTQKRAFLLSTDQMPLAWMKSEP